MILYEGRYSDDKRNEFGKEYYFYDAKLKYEGEYLNGKWHEKGKFYRINGIIEFEGEFKEGIKWNGKGKEIKEKQIIFEGEYKDGQKWNGKGKEISSDGKMQFEIEYRDGRKLKGEGKMINKTNNEILDKIKSNKNRKSKENNTENGAHKNSFIF